MGFSHRLEFGRKSPKPLLLLSQLSGRGAGIVISYLLMSSFNLWSPSFQAAGLALSYVWQKCVAAMDRQVPAFRPLGWHCHNSGSRSSTGTSPSPSFQAAGLALSSVTERDRALAIASPSFQAAGLALSSRSRCALISATCRPSFQAAGLALS